MWRPSLNHLNNTTLLSVSPLLFLIFLSCFTPTKASRQLDLCKYMNCGKGTCESPSLFSLNCKCKAGWAKLQIGSFTLPPCIVPDCIIDFNCGSITPSPSSPLLPLFIPSSLNLSDPCGLWWCGDGTCEKTGKGNDFYCKCNQGSTNILSSPELPCLKECHIGANCTGPLF